MKTTYQLCIIVLLALALQGCNKFLETESGNRLSVDQIFADFEGARTTLIGCYDNLKEASYYQRNFGLYADLVGGNIQYSRSNDPFMLNAYNFTNTNLSTQNDMTDFYKIAYNTIYRANNILAFAGKIPDANTAQKNRMLADAYMFRAMAHFDLVRVFAQPYIFTPNAQHPGIALRTQNTTGSEAAVPVNTVAEVYQKITSDLDSALTLYGSSTPIYAGGNARSYFSNEAAQALLCRVLLYSTNYVRAEQLATELINTNSYPLVSNAAYAQSWARTASVSIDQETIFYLDARIVVNQASFGDNFNPLNRTFGYMASSSSLLEAFAPGDVRGQATMQVQSSTNNIPFFYTQKYQGRNETANHQKLFRISEVHLARA
ncbi:MAG: hypothetical protein EAY75_11535, partial [Bacteroidetes bacterium]